MKTYIIYFIYLLPFFCYCQIPCEELNATGTSNGLNFTLVFNGQIDNWISYSVNEEILNYQNNNNNHSVTLVNEDGSSIDSFITCIYWENDVCCILFSWNGLTWSGTPTSGIEFPLSIESINSINKKKLIKMIDFLGNEIKGNSTIPFIKIFDDGSVEKVLIIEK